MNCLALFWMCHFSTTCSSTAKELVRSSDGSLLSLALCPSWPPLVFSLYLESSSLHQINPRCIKITFPLAFKTICDPLWLGLVGWFGYSHSLNPAMSCPCCCCSFSSNFTWLVDIQANSDQRIHAFSYVIFARIFFCKGDNFVPYCVLSIFWSVSLLCLLLETLSPPGYSLNLKFGFMMSAQNRSSAPATC